MSDFANRIEQARGILPLRRLMEQYGKGPANGNWKSFPKCPYCAKKGGAGTFGQGNGELFKCHHTSCPSGTAGDGKAWDAIGFLAYESALSRKDAAVLFLKQAGLWQERERSPSIMPGKGGRKNKLPSDLAKDLGAADRTSANPTSGSEDRSDTGTTAPSNLASGVVAPVVAPQCNSGEGDSPSQAGRTTPDAALVPAGGIGSGTDPVSSERSNEEPTAGNKTFSDGPSLVDEIKAEPSTDAGVERPICPASQPSEKQSPPESNQTAAVIGDASLEPAASKLPAADAPTAAGSLNGASTQQRPTEESKIVTMTGQPVKTDEAAVVKAPSGFVIELPPGAKVLHEFFARLNLSEADEKNLFEKRGLASRTSKLLQFRSSPKANKEILIALSSEFPWDDLYASGLWHREDRKLKKERRPNAKFYGFGICGKKPNGDWEYTWNNPVIIPYFDETGLLLSLRPHKDMGAGGTLTGTPHVYIPRALPAGDKPEVFETVVITEGEFKAAALWQIVGAGREDGKPPVGVAALPGISFGKNYEVREELDGWLRRVKCRCVKVIYDNEEKGDPKFKEAYKSDRRTRFDAQIWARYLATDIAQKLHIRGEVGVLPNDWRNEKGKADWDGAMAQFAKQAA